MSHSLFWSLLYLRDDFWLFLSHAMNWTDIAQEVCWCFLANRGSFVEHFCFFCSLRVEMHIYAFACIQEKKIKKRLLKYLFRELNCGQITLYSLRYFRYSFIFKTCKLRCVPQNSQVLSFCHCSLDQSKQCFELATAIKHKYLSKTKIT